MEVTTKRILWASAVSIALATVAFPVVSGQQRLRGGPPPPPQSAQQAGADRPHRLLGVGRDGRLALADGDAAERATTRACRSIKPRAKAADAWDLAKGRGRRDCSAGPLRRRQHHAAAGAAAYHLAGREHPEGGVGRGHADAALLLRGSAGPPLGRRPGRGRRRPRGERPGRNAVADARVAESRRHEPSARRRAAAGPARWRHRGTPRCSKVDRSA